MKTAIALEQKQNRAHSKARGEKHKLVYKNAFHRSANVCGKKTKNPSDTGMKRRGLDFNLGQAPHAYLSFSCITLNRCRYAGVRSGRLACSHCGLAVNPPRKQVTMFIQTTESRGIYIYDEKSQLLAAVLHLACLA